jgi:DNA mismatch endonuclease, patch repair protein
MQRRFDTTADVSRIMASIKSAETRPEMLLRKNLWKQGVRSYRKYPQLPGRPDLCFPTHRLIVFVDGCFWHGCPVHCRLPKKNPHYWTEKIAANKKRDARIDQELQSKGFTVLRIWEHDINGDVCKAVEKVKSFLYGQLDSST